MECKDLISIVTKPDSFPNLETFDFSTVEFAVTIYSPKFLVDLFDHIGSTKHLKTLKLSVK